MSDQKIIFDFFQQLGFSEIEAKIYLTLLEKGDLTTLEISRALNLPRTSLYRKLEKMKEKGLVDEVVDEYKTKVKPASIETLERLVKEEVSTIDRLQNLLPQVKKYAQGTADRGENLTKILYFRGQEAVTRMSWGALKTKDLFRGYSYRQFAELIGFRNALIFKEEWNRKGIKGREIFSDEYLNHRRNNPKLDTGKWSNFEARYLPSSILNISHQLDIYDDFVAIYNWHEGEVFGVLIKNRKVADFQKQIFDILWEKGEIQKY